MPELPEVETVVRGLRKTIVGQAIAGIKISSKAEISPSKAKFISLTLGARFLSVKRRGKNILINLSNGNVLWVHLKMAGHFYFRPSSNPIDKHDHVIFSLKESGYDLRFNDYRRFGRLRLFPASQIMQQAGLDDLGPEPLDISKGDFVSLLKSSRRMIKPALLDQTFIAGIGNIYADEALHRAGIHPRRLTDSLSPKLAGELYRHIQIVLKKAIRLMGTSVDTFAGVDGQPGRYQKCLLVYGREGMPCRTCGTKIVREKIGSRSAHFCPRCQRRR